MYSRLIGGGSYALNSLLSEEDTTKRPKNLFIWMVKSGIRYFGRLLGVVLEEDLICRSKIREDCQWRDY